MDLAYSTATGTIIGVTDQQEIGRSTDGGKTFGSDISHSFTASINCVDFGDDVFIAASGGGEISRSTNDGVTWSSLVSNAFDTAGDAIFSLAYGNGVWVAVGSHTTFMLVSTNDGATWSAPTTPPSTTRDPVEVVYVGNDTFIMAEASQNGDDGIKFFISSDSGDTWSLASTLIYGVDDNSTYCYGIAYGNGVLFTSVSWAGGDLRGYYSTDLGSTWTRSSFDGDLKGNPVYANNLFFVDKKVSTDGCRTFTVTNQALDFDIISAVYSIEDNIVTVGGDTGETYYSEWLEAGAGIVEAGSDTNGYYRKFSDGTMIQWGSATHTCTIATSFMGGYRSSGQSTTLPEAFADTNYYCSGRGEVSSSFTAGVETNSTTTMNAVFTAISSQGSASRVVHWFAIGTWK
jgi:hypothetical protein